jgi:hypothetical protein
MGLVIICCYTQGQSSSCVLLWLVEMTNVRNYM